MGAGRPALSGNPRRGGLDKAFRATGLDRRHWATADPIRKIFRRAFTAAGHPYYPPHRLRDTLATLGEKLCRTPEQFKAFSQNIGHSGVLTTFMNYGEVSQTRQAELIRGLGERPAPSMEAVEEMAALVGATRLDQVANEFFLHDGVGNGPSVKFQGAVYMAGQFGAWTAIGAEKIASGYEVAWKNGAADQYTAWNLDANGNYTGNAIGVVSGSSAALEALEPSFHQDLNNDGMIGLPTTVIEALGSTSLVQVGNNYFLYPVGGDATNAGTPSPNTALMVSYMASTFAPPGSHSSASNLASVSEPQQPFLAPVHT